MLSSCCLCDEFDSWQIRPRQLSDSIDGEMDPTLLEAVSSKNYSAVAEVSHNVVD